LSFILHFNINKLEASFFLATKPPWKNELTLGNVITYLTWLGAIFHQMPMIIIVETFDLWQVPFRIFRHWLFTWHLFHVVMKLQLTLAPFMFVPTFASTILSSMVFMDDPTSNFTLEVQKAFVFHVFHHFHQTLNDAPPSSSMDSITCPKVKTTKGEGVEVHSLARSTSRLKVCVEALGWD